MKAIVYAEHGGPEVLKYVEVAEPVAVGEVLVRVRACALISVIPQAAGSPLPLGRREICRSLYQFRLLGTREFDGRDRI